MTWKKWTFFFFQAYNAIHLDLERYLRSHGINQVTIQPEFPGDISDDQMINSALKDCCYLNCHSDWCEPRKCCDETQKAQINTTVIIWKKNRYKNIRTNNATGVKPYHHLSWRLSDNFIFFVRCYMKYQFWKIKCLER